MKRRKGSGGRTAVSILASVKPWAWPAWKCEIYAERGRAAVLIRYVRLLGKKTVARPGAGSKRRLLAQDSWSGYSGWLTDSSSRRSSARARLTSVCRVLSASVRSGKESSGR